MDDPPRAMAGECTRSSGRVERVEIRRVEDYDQAASGSAHGRSQAVEREVKIVACAGLALLLGGCSATSPRPEAAPTAGDALEAAPPPGPSFLGYAFGATRDELLVGPPALVFAPDGASAEISLDVDGVTVPLQLRLHRERLYSVSFRLGGAGATIDAYRTIVAQVEAGLGDGASTRCESEDGVAFEQFVATGQGALRTEWRDAQIVGDVSFSRSYEPTAPFEIRGYATAARLAPPCVPDDTVCGEKEGASRTVAGNDASGCSVDLSAAAPASVMGLAFGAPRAEVEAALGQTLGSDSWWGAGLPREIAGAAGRLRLDFYDGCLAVVGFQTDDGVATVDAYRAAQAWARSELGPGAAFRCVSEEGVPDMQHVEAGRGSFHTRWRGGEALEAELRLEALYGTREAPRIVLEVSYLPLRPHAPRIDF
jgi:hypothetical protein